MMHRFAGSLVLFLTLVCATQVAAAEKGSETTVRCGDIVEGQFVKQYMHNDYLVKMQPGDVIKFSAVAVGDVLRLYGRIFEPSGNRILQTESSQHLRGTTSVLSAPGEYRLELYNESAGVYTLHVGCILRDGTEILAGTGGAVGAGGGGLAGAPGAVQGVGSAIGAIGQDLSSSVGGNFGGKGDELSYKIARTTHQIDQATTGVEKLAETYFRIRSMFPRRKKKKNSQPQQPQPQQQPTHGTVTTGMASGTVGQGFVAPPPVGGGGGGGGGGQALAPKAIPRAKVEFPTLELDLSLGGSLTPGVSEVFGFHIEAGAGSRATLDLQRTGGNLYLGVQLLAPGGATLFQTTLMGNDPLASVVSFPVAGRYTVKVVRTDLAPVANPQMTLFQIGLAKSAH